jgi:hypothetical protein
VNPFCEFHGWFSQSLTRWPAHLGDRHLSPKSRTSSYTTPRDAIVTVVQSRRLCCDLALHRLDFSGTARRPGSRRAKTAFGRRTDIPLLARDLADVRRPLIGLFR